MTNHYHPFIDTLIEFKARDGWLRVLHVQLVSARGVGQQQDLLPPTHRRSGRREQGWGARREQQSKGLWSLMFIQYVCHSVCYNVTFSDCGNFSPAAMQCQDHHFTFCFNSLLSRISGGRGEAGGQHFAAVESQGERQRQRQQQPRPWGGQSRAQYGGQNIGYQDLNLKPWRRVTDKLFWFNLMCLISLYTCV